MPLPQPQQQQHFREICCREMPNNSDTTTSAGVARPSSCTCGANQNQNQNQQVQNHGRFCDVTISFPSRPYAEHVHAHKILLDLLSPDFFGPLFALVGEGGQISSELSSASSFFVEDTMCEQVSRMGPALMELLYDSHLAAAIAPTAATTQQQQESAAVLLSGAAPTARKTQTEERPGRSPAGMSQRLVRKAPGHGSTTTQEEPLRQQRATTQQDVADDDDVEDLISLYALAQHWRVPPLLLATIEDACISSITSTNGNNGNGNCQLTTFSNAIRGLVAIDALVVAQAKHRSYKMSEQDQRNMNQKNANGGSVSGRISALVPAAAIVPVIMIAPSNHDDGTNDVDDNDGGTRRHQEEAQNDADERAKDGHLRFTGHHKNNNLPVVSSLANDDPEQHSSSSSTSTADDDADRQQQEEDGDEAEQEGNAHDGTATANTTTAGGSRVVWLGDLHERCKRAIAIEEEGVGGAFGNASSCSLASDSVFDYLVAVGDSDSSVEAERFDFLVEKPTSSRSADDNTIVAVGLQELLHTVSSVQLLDLVLMTSDYIFDAYGRCGADEDGDNEEQPPRVTKERREQEEEESVIHARHIPLSRLICAFFAIQDENVQWNGDANGELQKEHSNLDACRKLVKGFLGNSAQHQQHVDPTATTTAFLLTWYPPSRLVMHAVFRFSVRWQLHELTSMCLVMAQQQQQRYLDLNAVFFEENGVSTTGAGGGASSSSLSASAAAMKLLLVPSGHRTTMDDAIKKRQREEEEETTADGDYDDNDVDDQLDAVDGANPNRHRHRRRVEAVWGASASAIDAPAAVSTINNNKTKKKNATSSSSDVRPPPPPGGNADGDGDGDGGGETQESLLLFPEVSATTGDVAAGGARGRRMVEAPLLLSPGSLPSSITPAAVGVGPTSGEQRRAQEEKSSGMSTIECLLQALRDGRSRVTITTLSSSTDESSNNNNNCPTLSSIGATTAAAANSSSSSKTKTSSDDKNQEREHGEDSNKLVVFSLDDVTTSIRCQQQKHAESLLTLRDRILADVDAAVDNSEDRIRNKIINAKFLNPLQLQKVQLAQLCEELRAADVTLQEARRSVECAEGDAAVAVRRLTDSMLAARGSVESETARLRAVHREVSDVRCAIAQVESAAGPQLSAEVSSELLAVGSKVASLVQQVEARVRGVLGGGVRGGNNGGGSEGAVADVQ